MLCLSGFELYSRWVPLSNCSLPRVISYIFQTSEITDLKTKVNGMIRLHGYAFYKEKI